VNVGILGGGQLGRMLALSGYPLGITFRFLEPASESSAAQVGERIQAEYEDYQALFRFASGMDVITYEFENVPVESVRWLSDRLPVFPSSDALAIAQDRIAEKTFFQSLGIPTPPFVAIDNRNDFDRAIRQIGFPSVLKTTRFGYDGKGQTVLRNPEDAESAWIHLSGRALILEQFISFQRELSIIGVRSRGGDCRFYPLVENYHREGMLRQSLAPAPNLTSELQTKAERYAQTALEKLDYVGILTIELFEKQNELFVNEMAPRVHNSGHWTIEGAETSQFENHLRAILGLPLGSTNTRGYCALINLIGEVPSIEKMLIEVGGHVHLYGKKPKPNRKLGHFTLRDDRYSELMDRIKKFEQIVIGK
jgi:5-(carboxyamino)imidazole ribonucleotide synthase